MHSGNDASQLLPTGYSADLVAAFTIVVVISAALFALAIRTVRNLPPRRAAAFAGILVLALVLFNALGRDSLLAARLLPVSSALLLADLTLPLAALLAGTLAVSLPPRRRILLPGLLLLIAGAQTARPLFDTAPPLHASQPLDGVVRQSSDASCGAASAATLLLAQGIPATEPEMAVACRTRSDGTAMLGLYRGLVLKTRTSPYTVATLVGANVDSLLRTAAKEGPVLIDVGLPRYSVHPVDPRYQSEWGWTPGLRHAIVFFGVLPNGKIDIGDPSTGREKWDQKALTVLWDGEGLYLTPR